MGNQIISKVFAGGGGDFKRGGDPSQAGGGLPPFGIPTLGGGEHSQKSCRACTDFKSWAKLQNKGKTRKREETGGGDNPGGDQQVDEGIEVDREHLECPLDKDELGRSTWGLLHTMAEYFPEEATPRQGKEMGAFLKIFAKYYPCEHCAQDFQKSIKACPPETGGRQELSQWMCRMHNEVNRKLGKPEFDCSRVTERWRDGWKDGTCD